MTPAETKELVRETVKETLLSMGLASDDHESITNLQQDMAWIRKQRKGTEEVAKWVRRGLITSAVSGAIYLILEGFKLAIK